MNFTYIVNIGLISILIFFCYHHSSAAQTNIFTGFMQSKQVTVVSIPIDASVSELFIEHNQSIEKNDKLLTVQSVKLKRLTQTAISDYFIKKKIKNMALEEANNHQMYAKLDIKPRRQYELKTLNYQQSEIELEKALRNLMIYINVSHPLHTTIRNTNPDNQNAIKQILTHDLIGYHTVTAKTSGKVHIPLQGKNCQDTHDYCHLSSGYQIAAGENFLYILNPDAREIKAQVPSSLVRSLIIGQPVKISQQNLRQPIKGNIARISHFLPSQVISHPFEKNVTVIIRISDNDTKRSLQIPLGSPVKITLINNIHPIDNT